MLWWCAAVPRACVSVLWVQKILSKTYFKTSDWFFSRILWWKSLQVLTPEKLKLRFACSNLTLRVCWSTRFLVQHSDILDLSLNFGCVINGMLCKLSCQSRAWHLYFMRIASCHLQAVLGCFGNSFHSYLIAMFWLIFIFLFVCTVSYRSFYENLLLKKW